MVCANINHPDYKKLEQAVGTTAAHYLWDRHNGEVDFSISKSGNPSRFFTDAEAVYGAEGAIVASSEIRMPNFLKEFGDWITASSGLAQKIDENGEPHISQYIEYKRRREPAKASNKDHNFSNAINKADRLRKIFAKHGIVADVRLDKEMNAFGRVENENGKPVVYLGAKATAETAGHEFAHIYTDLLGYNHPLVREGIRQLINTPLYYEVKRTYPDLAPADFEMELLTTAIGREVKTLFETEDQRSAWATWINRLLTNIALKLGMPMSASKRLARDMVGGALAPKLEGTLSTKTRYSRELDAIKAIADAQKIKLETTRDATTGVEDSWYSIEEDRAKRYERLTSKVRDWFSLKQGNFTMPSYEYAAQRDFDRAGLRKDEKIKVGEQEATYEEYVEIKRIEENTYARVYGKLAHLYIEQAIKPTPEAAAEIARLSAGVPGESLPVDTGWFDYIKDNVGDIFAQLGFNTLDENVAPAQRDEMLAEFTIVSKALGLGTTIDDLIRHSDGFYSMVDWKTGSRFLSDALTERMLAGGEAQIERIGDSKLDKAKLELMFRALIFKGEYDPKAKFRMLSVVHLKNARDIATEHSVNMHAYLGIIEDYMANPDNGMTEAYNKYKAMNLFDAREYGAPRKLSSIVSQMPTDTAIAYLEERLVELKLKKAHGKDRQSRRDVDHEIDEVAKDLLALKAGKEKALDLDLDSDRRGVSDMSWMKAKVTGNRYSTHDPAVQVYFAALKERELNFKRRLDVYKAENEKFFKPIVEQYLADHPWKKAVNFASMGGLNFLDKQELFGFMWQEKNEPGKNGLYARIITQDQVGTGPGQFTQAQFEYNQWYRKSIKEIYESTMQKRAYTDFDRDVSVAQMMELPEELEEDFMPRVEMDMNELMQREGLSKKVATELLESMGNTFLDTVYAPNKVNKGLPVKYMGNDTINSTKSHTIDTNIMFERFAASLIKKDELDVALHLGQALGTILANKETSEGNKAFANTTSFLHDQIVLNVLDMKSDIAFNRLKPRVTIAGRVYHISPMKLLMSSKHWVGAATMWFKPVAAGWNTALIFIVNAKDALKGSIAKRLGIDPEDIDFTLSDLIAAHKDYAEVGLRLPGSKKSKLQAIAEHLHYMPDDYEYSKENTYLGARNPLLNINNAYFMHRIGEEYGSLVMLAAMLRHRKFTNTAGKTMSMWEAYDVSDTGEVTWKGGVRGRDSVDGSEIGELTSKEITTIERVSQRIHGGYRKSERTVLETTALGMLTLQFKKYMPSMLENLFQSDYLDESLGRYKKSDDGTLSWIARRNEGRARVFIKWFTQLLLMRKNDLYSYDRMPSEKRQHLMEVWITMTMMFAARALYAGMEDDDDDENNPWAVRQRRLIEDISTGYDPRDLLRSLQNGTVVMPKMFKTMVAVQDFLIDGALKGKRTKTGAYKGANTLQNAVPISSFWYEKQKYFDYEEK